MIDRKFVPTGKGTIEDQVKEIQDYLMHVSRKEKTSADESYAMLDEVYRSLTEQRNDYDAASLRELWNKMHSTNQVVVRGGGGGGSTVSLQNKTVSPTRLTQTIVADDGYSGLGSVTVNPIPSSFIVQKASVRPDAELVKTWTYDKRVVADEHVTIPAYSTTAVTLVASADLDIYIVDNATYTYLVVERVLSIPEYKSTYTGGAGKQEYALSTTNYELMYMPGGTFETLDGTRAATYSAALQSHGTYTRYLYWNAATTVTLYTSAGYGAGHTFTAPAIASGDTLTIKSPAFTIRGHTTYMKQAVFEQVDDIRNQYVIELWRVKRAPDLVNGWDNNSSVDSIVNDIKNNNCKLR